MTCSVDVDVLMCDVTVMDMVTVMCIVVCATQLYSCMACAGVRLMCAVGAVSVTPALGAGVNILAIDTWNARRDYV